jgi:hypothetical protein
MAPAGPPAGYSRVGYADAVRHGRQVTVITFWSGIGGDVPDGPLIFCTCAGIRDQGSRRTASGHRIRPPGCVTHSQSGRPLPPGCIGQVMPETWVGSASAG